MKIFKLYSKYKWKVAKPTLKPNYNKIPVIAYKADLESVDIFNDVYQTIKSEPFNKIKRTLSGGISYKRCNFRLPCYDCIPKYDKRKRFKEVEITLLTSEGFVRIQLSNRAAQAISGTQAYREFNKLCNKFGINLDNYKISKEDGLQAKSEIITDKTGPYRPNYCNKNIEFEHVHHLDYRSSFPAGLVKYHPEFKDVVEYVFNKKEELKNKNIPDDKNIYKSILNNTISGYFQSEYINYSLAHLCRDARNDNYDRIMKMTAKLQMSGRRIIGYNTDGIWYTGDVYHDNEEGPNLGQYKNDHIDCKLRYKSDGAYEFIENGIYTPVVKGTTRLDRTKNRDKWSWGDIFNTEAALITFTWDENKGIVYEES